MIGKRKRSLSVDVIATSAKTVDTNTFSLQPTIACDYQYLPLSTPPDAFDSPIACPSPSVASLSLTRQNLKQWDQLTKAPTPRQSTNSATASSSVSIEDVDLALTLNKIVMSSHQDAQEFKELINLAQEIISGARNSSMKASSVSQASRAIKDYAGAQENTNRAAVWPKIFKNGERGVCLDGLWNDKEWADDFLRQACDCEFRQRSVPLLQSGDRYNAEILQSTYPKIKNPKPDFVYGFNKAAFTDDETFVILPYKELASIAREVYYAFCLLELKSSTGEVEAAKLQLRRGSSAAISALEQLYDKATDPKAVTPVTVNERATRSMMFGYTMTPEAATLYLHWVGGSGNNRKYYTHDLRGYHMREEEQIKMLRRDFHNILDWGVFQRRKQLRDLHDALRSFDIPLGLSSPKKRPTVKDTPSKAECSTPGLTPAGSSSSPLLSSSNSKKQRLG